MARPATQRFMTAVNELETGGDIEPLLACFDPHAELSNLAMTEQGTDGTRRFWTSYRRQFFEIKSEFTGVIEEGDCAVLIWNAAGALAKGQPIQYRGASILTFRGDRVVRFETIYDSAAFLRDPASA